MDTPRHTFICHADRPDGKAQGHAKGKVTSIPDYTTISRRINKSNIKIKDTPDSNRFKDNYIIIAIGSNGIKVINRGQWMQETWQVKKTKEIFLLL